MLLDKWVDGVVVCAKTWDFWFVVHALIGEGGKGVELGNWCRVDKHGGKLL